MIDRGHFNYKDALFFPYGYEFAPVLSGLHKQGKIDKSVKLVAPPGWGVHGKDAGEAFGRPQLGLRITTDLKGEMEKCKSFIAIPYKATQDEETNRHLDRMIDGNMDIARSMGKTTLDLREIIKHEMPVINEEQEIEIECPVILINGIFEQVNKLDVMMGLSHSLAGKGYKVSQIGTRHNCDILNMHPFPQFMFDTISEKQKIQLFRAFVQSVCQEEEPDVVLIGVPGASIPFNDKVDNGYGIIHFLISMAVRSDFSITCTDYNFWELEKLDTLYMHRFGHGIDCAVMSNTRIQYDPIEYDYRLLYQALDYRRIDDFISNHPVKENIPIYNIFNPNDVESMTELLINELGDVQNIAM